MESRTILTAVVVSSLAFAAQSCYSAREHRAVEPQARSASQQTFASVQNVKQAEETLRKKGYDPGAVDGVMDSQLHQALSEFQRANRLQVTGNLDDQTAHMLGIKLAGET
jgi:peptidoglycan hydrolase-like protein with peptidoglycan-binding domain